MSDIPWFNASPEHSTTDRNRIDRNGGSGQSTYPWEFISVFRDASPYSVSPRRPLPRPWFLVRLAAALILGLIPILYVT